MAFVVHSLPLQLSSRSSSKETFSKYNLTKAQSCKPTPIVNAKSIFFSSNAARSLSTGGVFKLRRLPEQCQDGRNICNDRRAITCSLASPTANKWLQGFLLNFGLLSGAWILAPLKKALTAAGAIHAGVLGTIIWSTLGAPGYAIVVLYFLFGTAATRIGFSRKKALGISEKRDGARGPENVWGSGLTAAICCILISLGLPGIVAGWLKLAFVASFSTKLADTMSSEIGKAYGKTTFSITSLKRVPPGTEGGVSAEGSAAGIAAAVGLAVVGAAAGLVPSGVAGILVVVVAATVANVSESVIGATVQDRYPVLTNDVVNMINTAIGGATGFLLAALLRL